MLELILGGARSGKSRYAGQRASGRENAVYIATATAGDVEMQTRIARHRSDRAAHIGRPRWLTVEEPVFLAQALQKHAKTDAFVLVDCLTLWLTNLLLSDDANAFARERAEFLAVLPRLRGHVVFVSNEVGQGVVPVDALSRRFVDESGWLHQELAQCCQRVVLVTAGLPQLLKGVSLKEIT